LCRNTTEQNSIKQIVLQGKLEKKTIMTAKKMVNLHAYKCEKMNVISKDFFQE
jgi:hypothetical protein